MGYRDENKTWHLNAWKANNAQTHSQYCGHDSDWATWWSNVQGIAGLYSACPDGTNGGTYTKKKNHSYTAWTDSTEWPGWHYRKCNTCGYVDWGQHTYGSWRDAGNGQHVRHCTVCGHSEWKNHDMTSWADNSDTSNSTGTASITYTVHEAGSGWQPYVTNSQVAGTTGQNKALEAVAIKLNTDGISGDIKCQAYVQNKGWLSEVGSDQTAGTTGQGLRMESFRAYLTGDVAKKYNLWYRVHVQNIGWMNWTKDGLTAGTQNYSYQIEAIQVELDEKYGHTRYCTTCGKVEQKTHDFTPWYDTGDGTTHTRKCKDCGHTETATHDWSAWVDNPDGKTHTRTCQTCGRKETEAHTYGDWYDVGDRHEHKCTKCGHTESAPHVMEEPKVVKTETPDDHTTIVTYEEKCRDCPHAEYMKLTLKVTGVNEQPVTASRYGSDVPASQSAELYRATGTVSFSSNYEKDTHLHVNKVESNTIGVDLSSGRSLRNNATTFTWNQNEGQAHFIYTIHDSYSHDLSVTSQRSYLLDHTPPVVTVSVNLPGYLTPARTSPDIRSTSNPLTWTESTAVNDSDNTQERPYTIWNNIKRPIIMIDAKTPYLDSTEEANNLAELRLYKAWTEKDGTHRVALLRTWTNTNHAAYTIPESTQYDVNNRTAGTGEGVADYYVVAIDQLNRKTVSASALPQAVDTKAVYTALAGSNNYDMGNSISYAEDVNHVTVTPLTVRLDYSAPIITDLNGNGTSDEKGYWLKNSVLNFSIKDSTLRNRWSDVTDIKLYGFDANNTKTLVAEDNFMRDKTTAVSLGSSITGQGATWTNGTDSKTLSARDIVKNVGFYLDCQRTPGLSNVQYERYEIEATDTAGNVSHVRNIHTTQALLNTLHTTIDRSSYSTK
jgi:hypothetical protein